MKNTSFTLVLSLLSFFGVAQEKAHISTAEIAKGKEAGLFHFVIPNTIDAERVAEASAPYKTYFTVDFDKKKHVVSVKLTKNEEMNKRVIQRFLLSLNLEYVTVQDKEIAAAYLYDMYLKSETK